MSKSLPAYLQQLLEEQLAENNASDNAEVRQIIDRLSHLNERVEKAKAQILNKRRTSS